MLILENIIFLLHVHVIHLHFNIASYHVHGASHILGMFVSGIGTTICSKFYVLEKYKTCSCINVMKYISCIIINGRFAVIGRDTFGVVKNIPVITEN